MVNGNRDGEWQQEQLTEEKVSLTAKKCIMASKFDSACWISHCHGFCYCHCCQLVVTY